MGLRSNAISYLSQITFFIAHRCKDKFQHKLQISKRIPKVLKSTWFSNYDCNIFFLPENANIPFVSKKSLKIYFFKVLCY